MPLHEFKSFQTQDALAPPSGAGGLITWLFEEDSFSPIAKIKNDKQYSIVNDHLGTPYESYDDKGDLVWSRELNSNGKTIKETGISNFCPFLYQGQSYDAEIELAYNRFRYYDPEDGKYISQDPIGLLSGEFGFYNYVENPNLGIDIFGLAKSTYHLTYRHKIKAGKKTNLKELNRQRNAQVRAMNRIIKKEGIKGLKDRVRNYDKGLEQDGRSYTKSLGSPGDNKAWLHEPDMRTGGLPKDVAKIPGDKRTNSIIGGQANRIANDILNAPDDTTRITSSLITE